MLDFLRKVFGRQILNYYHLATAIMANFVYAFPSRKLQVIGVTGTDGKTTVVNMIASVLRASGLKVAHLSTVNAQIGEQIYETGLHTTTPSSFLVQKLLARGAKAGAQYFVLEVTSHALDQYRTWGIRFETAVLTNVSHEHLDYHKDMENYVAAKRRIFRNVEYRILNRDDWSYEHLTLPFSLSRRGRKAEPLTYGLSPNSSIRADRIQETLTNTKFTAHTPTETIPVELNLPGRFNVENALAAIAVGHIYNIPPKAILRGLESVKGIDGRIEFITPTLVPPHQGEGRMPVIIDFAHTPNAISRIMEFLRPKVVGRIIHVFGSAGERDRGKRSLMGEVSDKFADLIILTREDNRSEKVEEICEEIAAGIRNKQRNKGYFIIPDRREAIRAALGRAQARNDLVIISGKGHEQSLNVDGKEIPWDDRKVAQEELEKVVSSKF